MNIAILTLNGNFNFGNKLQSYALQQTLNQFGKCDTIWCHSIHPALYKINSCGMKFFDTLNFHGFKTNTNEEKISNNKRYCSFLKFDKLINYSSTYIYKSNFFRHKPYDFYVVGSDQVWNTTFDTFMELYLLKNIESSKRISYAASFGFDTLPDEHTELFKKELEMFNAISVREDAGKEIVNKLTNREDIEVLIDPTLLLDTDDWDKVSKKPKNLKSERYILNYFLGELSDDRRKIINQIAKEYNCTVINLTDVHDPLYCSGPSEFLYLEKNAFLICTDSFHSCVFAFLYNRPFVAFNREDANVNMNSRLDTLISKFKLTGRNYNGQAITEENLNHDYSEGYKILEDERKKSLNFLNKAFNKGGQSDEQVN